MWTTLFQKRVKNTKNGHFGLRLGLFCDSIVIYVNYCAHTRERIRGIMSSTTYAKRTLYKPIDFFYRSVAEAKTKKVAFVDAFQILNDRYLGRMSVCNYFFIAENSVRINELNVIALDELKNYHLVMRENFLIPEKVTYSLPITTRFLEKESEFEVLLASLKDNGYKKGSLIISFNSNTIVRLDAEGKKRYDRLRRLGYQTCINGFGEEFNSLDIFAKFNFDYLRLEASYFDSTQPKKKILSMLVKHCNANKIGLVMEGVDSPGQYNRFKREGVKYVTGKAVCKLSRFVTNELLNLPNPTGEKKAAYLKKLEKELADIAKKEQAEYDALRLAAKEKAKADAASGKVSPVAPRPELIKSPYQVRLEQQKEAARRAALQRAERNAARQEELRLTKEEYQEKRLIEEASRGMFEGDIQSMLATRASLDAKKAKAESKADKEDKPTKAKADKPKKDIAPDTATENKLMAEYAGSSLDSGLGGSMGMGGMGLSGFGGAPVIHKHDDEEEKKAKSTKKSDKSAKIDKDEVTETVTNPEDTAKTDTKSTKSTKADKPKKDIVADTDKEKKLLNEFKGGSLDSMLGMGGPMGGFGVTLSFDDDDDEEVIVGHYNEKGQWIDEDGYIYNGYFDENGDWQDYETFDSKEEGSYNDQGQWVDKDGKVYDGYFDEKGRWIDYTYVNAEGQVVDNGYFDKKIKKWIPYGYFDENGIWREYN